jgi:hypothetical protein
MATATEEKKPTFAKVILGEKKKPLLLVKWRKPPPLSCGCLCLKDSKQATIGLRVLLTALNPFPVSLHLALVALVCHAFLPPQPNNRPNSRPIHVLSVSSLLRHHWVLRGN